MKTIDTYIFATRSNTTDFGDLTAVRKAGQGGGNGVQCTFGGGSDGGTLDTTIDITTFASTGTCVEFGDYTFNDIDGSGTIDIIMNCEFPVSNFDIEISGLEISGLYGGASEESDFNISYTSSSVTGSDTGSSYISPNSGLLTTINFSSIN